MVDAPMMDPNKERDAKRRRRNWALGGTLMAMVILFFFITIARMGASS